MNTNDETLALCALNKIFGTYPRLGLSLLEEYGSATAVFHEKPPIPAHPELAAQLTADALTWARQELERLENSGFRFLGLHDEDYPAALRECADPPLGLYLNGSTSPSEIFGLRPCIAFVGTRDISPYGRSWCQKLVAELSRAPVQPCIVSGMAFGADGIAHRTALECGLPTIGVMATGIDKVYPWQHRDLAMAIVRAPGCALITDYPMGTDPVAWNFVRRNRIIAGLSLAVLVVESKTKGGSLLTAKYACSYGREVYALPGRADDIRSAGCNSLIREQMAQIITSPEQLAADLGLMGSKGRGRAAERHEEVLRRALSTKYGPEAPAVVLGLALRTQPGATAEELAAGAGLPFSQALQAMSLLELDGFSSTDILGRCFLTPAWS